MIDITKTANFNKFKIDLNEMLKDDKVILAMYKQHCVVNDLSKIDFSILSKISVSTLRRIDVFDNFGSKDIREKIINVIKLEQNISLETLAKLELNIQCLFACNYYGHYEEELLYYDKLISLEKEFVNTIFEIVITIIKINFRWISIDEVNKNIELFEKIKKHFPNWLQKIIDRNILIGNAAIQEVQSVYTYIEIIDTNPEKDIWYEIARSAFAIAMDYICDYCSELHYLHQQIDLKDISQVKNASKTYLNIARVFLRQGNTYQANKYIKQSKLISTTSELIENQRKMLTAYLAFFDENYASIIENTEDIKPIMLDNFSKSFLRMYAFNKLNSKVEFNSELKELKENTKDIKDFNVVIEAFILMLNNGNKTEIKKMCKEVQKISLIKTRIAFWMLEVLYNRIVK